MNNIELAIDCQGRPLHATCDPHVTKYFAGLYRVVVHVGGVEIELRYVAPADLATIASQLLNAIGDTLAAPPTGGDATAAHTTEQIADALPAGDHDHGGEA